MAQTGTAAIGNDGTIGTGVFDQLNNNATHYALIGQWRASFPRVVSNVTGFSHTLEHNRLGVTRIEGSLTGNPLFNAGSTSPGVQDRLAGGSSTILQVATGCTYTATLAYSNFGFDVNKQADNAFTADFVNGDSDTLTETWDETP